jgi:hypothetical protein
MAEKFKYLRSLWGTGGPTILQVVVGASQTIVKGDLIKIDATNGKAILFTAASTGIIGIALEDITTGASPTDADVLNVIALDSRSVIRCVNYTAGTTDAATSAMCWGKAKYDVQTDGKIDFNDVTGGFLIPIAPSDTVAGTTDVVISAAALWNA